MRSGILLVEDDPEDQFIFLDAIDSVEHAEPVHSENNGVDALRYLQTLSSHQLPCIILADLNMPVMNGSELLTHLKEHEQFRDIPVVIYTTSFNTLEKETCLRLGAHAYITKPLSYRQSIEVARSIVQMCRQWQEL